MWSKKIANNNIKLNTKKISNQFIKKDFNKFKSIENMLNKMHFALFNQKINQDTPWNNFRTEILEDLHEVLRKIQFQSLNIDTKYGINDFEFVGFQDNIDFINKNLKAFFMLKDFKSQLAFKFHKYICEKSQVIDHFIKIANQNSIIEDDEFMNVWSKNQIENWKKELYVWIGEKITLNGEEIEVILERFEFIDLEVQSKSVHIAWYKYFNKFDSIPVKIITKKDEKDEKVDDIFIEIENWHSSFLKFIIPISIVCVFLFIAYVINCKGLLLKLKNLRNSISSEYSWKRIPSDDYALELYDYLQDNISNDFHNNVDEVSVVEPRELMKIASQAFKQFASLKKTAFLYSSKSINPNVEKRLDLSRELEKWDDKFDKLFSDPWIVEHNLDFLKWGVFDIIRYGRFKVANCEHEFVFTIERKNFQQPSQILINKFYENILKIFENIHISKQNIVSEEIFVSVSKIIINILNAKAHLNFFNNLYVFSSDSFWIEGEELEDDFITANIRHLLFPDPLSIKMNFFTDGNIKD